MNAAQAGRAVPLEWRLVRADGSPVVDLASASVRSWRAVSVVLGDGSVHAALFAFR